MTESEKGERNCLGGQGRFTVTKNPACGTSKISVVLYEIV